MKRIVHAMPAARSALIAGLATAYAGLADDFPEVHHPLPGSVYVGRSACSSCICTLHLQARGTGSIPAAAVASVPDLV
jgi:hypothetical protein